MTQKIIKILLVISLLVVLLGGYYWYFVLPSFNNGSESEEATSKNSELFGLNAKLLEGWSKNVKESLVQENGQQETVEFRKDSITVIVDIKLIRSKRQNEVFTGFIPETREYLTASNPPIELGKLNDIRLGRVRTEEGYSLVDLNSLILREEQNTYIYELPILVSREEYETKAVITYTLNNQIDNSKLLEEADTLVLSLNTNTP